MPCKRLQIGVFFDGTGNNKTNDIAGDEQTNIAKLSDLYGYSTPQTQDLPLGVCELSTKMIYIQGLGTVAGEEDHLTGLTTGSRGAERIYEAIDKVLELFTLHPEKEYNRIIDVFGFSRGAAQARDFINTLNKSSGEDEKFTYGFVGLYDTVGSFGEAGNNVNMKPLRDSGYQEHEYTATGRALGTLTGDPASVNHGDELPWHKSYINADTTAFFEEYNFNLSRDSAKKIVQLAAGDEYRGNFPLHNIAGAGSQYQLIGVHSDIGGGYGPATEEYASFTPVLPQWNRQSIPSRWYNRTSISRQVVAQAAQIEKQLNDAHVLDDVWTCKEEYNWGFQQHSVVCEQKRTITNDLQKVSLVAMHTQGLMHEVPFRPLATIEIPLALRDYHSFSMSKLAAVPSYESRKAILFQYAHRSAIDQKEASHHRDANPIDDAFEFQEYKDYAGDMAGNNMRYQGRTPEREVYANQTNKAIPRNS